MRTGTLLRVAGAVLLLGAASTAGVLSTGVARKPLPGVHPGKKATVELEDVPSVLGANARNSETRASLRTLALDEGKDPSLRYVALRKLESVAPEVAAPVAAALTSSASTLVRTNALAVLVRAHTRESEATLDRICRSSKEDAVLVTQLRGGL